MNRIVDCITLQGRSTSGPLTEFARTLKALIARRPATYGRFAGLVGKLPH